MLGLQPRSRLRLLGTQGKEAHVLRTPQATWQTDGAPSSWLLPPDPTLAAAARWGVWGPGFGNFLSVRLPSLCFLNNKISTPARSPQLHKSPLVWELPTCPESMPGAAPAPLLRPRARQGQPPAPVTQLTTQPISFESHGQRRDSEASQNQKCVPGTRHQQWKPQQPTGGKWLLAT